MPLEINLLDNYVGNALSTTEFVGGMLISLLFLLSVVISINLITKNGNVTTVSAVLSIIFCAGVEWIPTWVPILIVMIIAVMYGNFASKMLGG